MSLSPEAFLEAIERLEKADKRLTALLGCNLSNTNHYGAVYLYNREITDDTTDEEILSIRAKFVKWRDGIRAIIEKIEENFTNEAFDGMFSTDGAFGSFKFLGKWLDVDADPELFRADIEKYFENN